MRLVIFLNFLFLQLIMFSSYAQEPSFTPKPELYKRFDPQGSILRKQTADEKGFQIIEKESKGPGIRISWPPLKHEEYPYDIIRIAGSSVPDAEISINGSPVKIYPSGAFVYVVNNLKEGLNDITVIAKNQKGASQYTFQVNHIKKKIYQTTPQNVLIIEDDLMLPDSDLVLSEGDILTVQFKGTPDCNTYFKLDGIDEKFPMRELEPAKEGSMANVKGIYRGSFHITSDISLKKGPIYFYLKSEEGKVSKKKSIKTVEIKPKNPIRLVETIDVVNPLRTSPNESGSRIIDLPKGVIAEEVGEINNYYKIRLSASEVAYLYKQTVQPVKEGTPYPLVNLSSLKIIPEGKWTTISIPISQKIIYKIIPKINPGGVDLFLYGAINNIGIMYTDQGDNIVESIIPIQYEDKVTKISIVLREQQNWGCWGDYDDKGNFNLKIKHSPIRGKSNNDILKGLVFMLDPGHGGIYPGAVGPSGFEEQEVNLGIALSLKKRLEESGAKVVLTREADVDISLADRVKFAIDNNADISISIHNNSCGENLDPLTEKGTSVYYYQPFSRRLAGNVFEELVKIGLNPENYNFMGFYLVRPSYFPAILVEGAYMSNPIDEMMLIDVEFQTKIADAIFKGINKFLISSK